jgi:hypothetical protein
MYPRNTARSRIPPTVRPCWVAMHLVRITMGPKWNPFTTLNTLVSPTSHGCVRMANTDNITLHQMMPHPAHIPIVFKRK